VGKLWRRIRGAVGMGLTWAAGWAVAGILIGVMSKLTPNLPWDSFFEVFDAPLPALALPGFIGGVLFSIVLGIAGRHRRFDELSVSRFAIWGAIGGVLLSLVPDALVAMGLATIYPERPGSVASYRNDHRPFDAHERGFGGSVTDAGQKRTSAAIAGGRRRARRCRTQ